MTAPCEQECEERAVRGERERILKALRRRGVAFHADSGVLGLVVMLGDVEAILEAE